MKYLIILLVSTFSLSNSANACTMFKITKDGKTIVGNNEDWISPNSQFWFVKGEEGEYDVMNVGLINNFAQGAINNKGLVFDGFANPFLEIKNVEWKKDIPIGQAVRKIMHSYENVREVKAYLSTINLSSLAGGQLVFVDRSGTYLIVEGDELIIGSESEKSFSNFYYSQIESIEEVELQNVKNGLAYLKNVTPDPTLEYCGTVMNNFSNPDGFTQYSTIYDLEKLTIRVYLFHDYSEYVEINLLEELEKGDRKMMIPELFSKDSQGYQNYSKFNDAEDPARFVREWVEEESRTEEQLVKSGFAYNINVIGYEWLYDKNNIKGAIKIFEYATDIMPNDANLYDSLGEAYWKNENYLAAISNYEKSLLLNPKNNNAKDALKQIKKIVKNKIQPQIIRSSKNTASFRAGDSYWEDSWKIIDYEDPSTWYVVPEPNESKRVTYITDLDSLTFDVHLNELIKFKVVLNEKDTVNLQIKGVDVKAVFDEAYQSEHRNKTFVEIPEIYELINVVFALTSLSAEENSHVVRTDVPYHQVVIDWFEKYQEHEVVKVIDEILRADFSMYYGLKMDSYIYHFVDDKIVSKEIYNRIAQNVGENVMPSELLLQLEDFYHKTNFKEFYNRNLDLYNKQIAHFEKEINTAQMQSWLNKNFPKTSYDCFIVIFSPLVDWNQSAAWFDNNGFKEAQAHINFPYPSESDKKRTKAENILMDGQILFTEFNHAFINPEAEPYFKTKQFKEAFSNLGFWTVEESVAAKSYSNAASTFNEYMNWCLVSLYFLDTTPENVYKSAIEANTEWQTNKRGFKHFKSFNENLIKLYTNRKEGQTVADLYPEIIAWCHQFASENSKKK